VKCSLFCKFLPFSDYLSSHEKRYQAIPLLRTASDRKLGGAWERGYLQLISLNTEAVQVCISLTSIGGTDRFVADKSCH